MDATLAARNALLAMIDWLVSERGFTRDQAYVICSASRSICASPRSSTCRTRWCRRSARSISSKGADMNGAPTIGGLDGAIAVVTGGASGIGEAVVRLLEQSGAIVRVADLGGGDPVDVTDRNALDRLARELDERHGRLDVLVNAAGVLTPESPGGRASRRRLPTRLRDQRARHGQRVPGVLPAPPRGPRRRSSTSPLRRRSSPCRSRPRTPPRRARWPP